MWVLKWNKTATGQSDYLREVFSEGKVLQFEWEEDALRFLELVKTGHSAEIKPIRYSVHRFSGDRKEKYKIIKSSMIERAADAVCIGIV